MKNTIRALMIVLSIICVITITREAKGKSIMTSKYSESGIDLEKTISELAKIFNKKIIVGPAAAENSELAKYAAANEYGAAITAKKGYLAIPCHPAAKDRRPSDFGDLVFIPGKNKGHAFLAKVSKGGKYRENYFLLKRTVRIPERSYLRGAFDKKETIDRAVRIGAEMVRRVLLGQANARDVLTAIGQSFVSSVKQRISSNVPPPNSALTLITKKRGSATLIDEGRLIGSIQDEVIG
ncbi:MAG: hypothetical protein JW807_00885 [Spirochaetes bacterium]|nr:hypothetical protein [Spirochaetota bacterium]